MRKTNKTTRKTPKTVPTVTYGMFDENNVISIIKLEKIMYPLNSIP